VVDLRKKISDEVKALVFDLKDSGRTVTSIAEEFKISRRAVDFIWDPKKAITNNQRTKARAKDGRYYDRERNTINVRRCRERKRKELLDGEK
jgi:hypothetical protein